MTDFGFDDPRAMPRHSFERSVSVHYRTAVRANTEKQNRSICPRYWYLDIVYPCERCGTAFTFSVAEQRVWYEQYHYWIDSAPKHCLECRRQLRHLKAARREYDASVERVLDGGGLEAKKRLADVIDQLYELGGKLPSRIHDTRRRLADQIARAER